MDSKNKDESSEPRRDEALARRMGEALDRLAPREAVECPDAEVIAAYFEKSLQPEEFAQWENHFATCGRCRRILAVLAAAVDAPLVDKEVAQLGELAAAARNPAQAPGRTIRPARSRWLDWRVRWLVPAFGVAAALAVWFAMRPALRTSDQGPSGTLIAQAPKSEPPQNTATPALEKFSRAPEKKSTETDAETLRQRDIPRAQSPIVSAQTPATNRPADSNAIGAIPPNGGAVGGMFGNGRKDQTDLKSAPAAAPPALERQVLPAPAVPPKTEAQAKEEAPSSAGAPGSTSQTVVITGETTAEVTPTPADKSKAAAREKQPAAAQASADTISGARGVVNGRLQTQQFGALSKLDEMRAGNVLVTAPSSASWWRAGKGGSIQRSTDAGRTWIPQTSPLQEDWLSGAAVSDTVCWVVGRNGAIARTTDGEHWEKITPPPLAAGVGGKLPDWIGVTAADAQSAAITSSDQRRFATQDGGKTWQIQ